MIDSTLITASLPAVLSSLKEAFGIAKSIKDFSDEAKLEGALSELRGRLTLRNLSLTLKLRCKKSMHKPVKSIDSWQSIETGKKRQLSTNLLSPFLALLFMLSRKAISVSRSLCITCVLSASTSNKSPFFKMVDCMDLLANAMSAT